MRRRFTLDHALRLLMLVSTVCLGGCRDDNPFSQVPVSGRILYEDGSIIPAKAMRLVFSSEAPAVGNQHPRPASAFVNVSDGTFSEATTLTNGDGLVRGKHKVVVDLTPLESQPNAVPEKYGRVTTTPLLVDTNNLPMDIRISKP
jgi:hypothetical protein